MKKKFLQMSLLVLSLLFIFVPTVQASSLMEDILKDEDGKIVFYNPELGGEYRELPNFPIQVSIEALKSDQPQIRMIWNLDDPSRDVVMPIEVKEIEPTAVPVLPDGEEYQANIEITIKEPVEEYYQGKIYLTDLASMGGIQLLLPNYAGNVEESQKEYYQVLTETSDQDQADLNIEDLDQAMKEWQANMGQEYSRFYPQSDQTSANSFSQEVLNNMIFEGQSIDLTKDDTYQLQAIYSTIGTESYNQVGPITYLMVVNDGNPQVWVSEDSQRKDVFDFKLTENAEIRDVFGQWYYQENVE